MKFNRPIYEGKLIKRYKRFFADVELNGRTILAHVPNTGSMKGCNEPNSPCRVSFTDDPNRKIQYTLEMVKSSTSWVGVNTSHPNKLVHELWESKKNKNWKPWDRAQREVKISDESRVDLVFWNSKAHPGEKLVKPNFKKLKGPFHFVEVKNVSLAQDGVAIFPDSVTLRGQKHIDELVKLVKLGHTAEFVFVIQRQDCKAFAPADKIDEVYGQKLREAAKAGVVITPLICDFDETGIVLGHKALKVKF